MGHVVAKAIYWPRAGRAPKVSSVELWAGGLRIGAIGGRRVVGLVVGLQNLTACAGGTPRLKLGVGAGDADADGKRVKCGVCLRVCQESLGHS